MYYDCAKANVADEYISICVTDQVFKRYIEVRNI